jgi:CHAT domain-containing protein
MPDWSHFRQRLKQGDNRFQIIERIREMDGWLDLPFGQALTQAQGAYAAFTDEQARPIYNGLPLQRHKLLRDAGITGDDAEINRRMHDLFARCDKGDVSLGEQQLALRLANSLQIGWFISQSHPDLVQQLTPEGVAADKAFFDSVAALFPRFSAVMQRSRAGSVLADNVAELVQLRAEFSKIAESAANEAQRHLIADRLARANYWLALNHALLQQEDDSRTAYLEAADWFDKAGAADQAADCRHRVQDLKSGLAGDTDQVLQDTLKAVLASHGDVDPLSRALAFAANAQAVSAAGDHFESARIAAQIAPELKKWALLDPQGSGFDAAIDSWIKNLPARFTGSAYLRAFCDVHQCYLCVLAQRSQDRSDQARAEEAFQLALTDKAEADELDVLSQANRNDAQAGFETAKDWAIYFPQASESPPLADQGQATFNRVSKLLELAWATLSAESENRASDLPQDDLVDRASKLEQQAVTLNLAFFNAKARMVHGQVLINAGKAAEAIAVLEEARTLILGANPISYGAFAGNAERGVYELILKYKCMAQAMTQDLQGWSDTCGEAIRFIETYRYLVNSPEGQNAFLDWRADFYRFGVAASRKLQHWDEMLERMELIKARSIIRSRLVPNTPQLDASEIAGQFREVCDRIQSTSDPASLADLNSRRRQLWDLLSIQKARQRTPQDPPQISVDNLQKALGTEEAALSYFWQTDSVLLAIVIDRQNFKVERIELSPADMSLYSEFVEGVQTLDSFNADMDWMAKELGEILLPGAVRELIGTKERLVISPHRTLHLFPFQGAVWDSKFLGQRFALRYAPNLSSLLLPWQSRAEKRLLALGIQHFLTVPFNQHSLPLAETEARDIAANYSARGIDVELLCGEQASRARFCELREQNQLSRFRWLHLATHGTSVFVKDTYDHPMESKLILQDGWLDGLEIAELCLEADLVVLSACSSGQRAVKGRGLNEVPGDDVFGLQSALFTSGVHSVLSALWPLRDQQAYDLVSRFHASFAAGNPADKALQHAVNSYLEDSPDREIFYWAGFFLNTLGSESNCA